MDAPYVSVVEIEEFFADNSNSINWGSRRVAEIGNLKTPTPGMGIFYDYLKRRDGKLFSQEDYEHEAFRRWAPWIAELSGKQRIGVRARIGRNFYPSGIDTLHARALIKESGFVWEVVIDTDIDVEKKVDLTVLLEGGKYFKIGLQMGNPYTKRWASYKVERRQNGESIDVATIYLPESRPRDPGNKRWYKLDDFLPTIFWYMGEVNK